MARQYVFRTGVVLGAMALLAACSPDAPPPQPPAAAPAAAPAAPAPAPAEASGPAATAADITLTEADGDRAFTLRRGKVVEVRLKADRISGLTWVPTANVQPAMRVEGMPQYEPDETAPEHTAGTEIWRFVAQQSGHAHLAFEYRRPFDREAPPAASVIYHFDIE